MGVFSDVRRFFEIGHPDKIRDKPGLPNAKTAALGLKLVAEEYGELTTAWERGDVVELADACADLIYVTAGLALMFGIPMHEVWDEVQRTNMAKFPNGEAILDETGKIQKPEGWKPPNIAAIIEAAK